jgi:hypothetical protein
MTYEHGKAPADAPVTYVVDGLGFVLRIETTNGAIITRGVERRDEADSICRAFHLAKLAEEAKSIIETGDYSPDWLCRFRAAKGEA